ncbi:LytR family transcriptional regulator [Microbacterium sp. 4R-513]|uniref:LCP family protein n=1 Tax=Microbacterium sp. 4R-513 TaxID=2567934 RepID=UPI0013E1EE69|nr:LCP family protein [Microbacterium sp. 4R-513]QIG38838.1 LytR family transcriptional regulator [Microbacterium sp. 4R-513]
MARRRRTVARHARLPSPRPLGQFFAIVGVCLAVLVVSLGGVAAYATYDLAASFADDVVDIPDQEAVPPDIGAIEGGVSVLLTGIDECEEEFKYLFGDRCKGPDSTTRLNDVNLLVHIGDSPRRVTVVSFPRDLIVPIPSCTREDGSTFGGGTDQLNTTYQYGGLGCVMKTISDLSDINIPFGAVVTFGGVIKVTDALGGVDVCLARGIRDRNTGLDLSAGTHTVSGVTALQFLRTRYGVGDGSDLGRISNQQQYMSRLANKLVSDDVLSNPAQLYKLAAVALDNVTPTRSLANPLTLVQIALAVKDVPFDEIVFVQYPTFTDPSDENRLRPDYSSAEVLWNALRDNQPLDITGDVGARGGVVDVTPTGAATPPAAEPTPGATPVETPAPPVDAVALPPTITGSTAAQQTCSGGNVRG